MLGEEAEEISKSQISLQWDICKNWEVIGDCSGDGSGDGELL